MAEKNEEKPSDCECAVCCSTVRDPVSTKCGHLFCWQCLEHWMKHQHSCPICRTALGDFDITPLYGIGYSSDVDPRPKSLKPSETTRTQQKPSISDDTLETGIMVGLGALGGILVGALGAVAVSALSSKKKQTSSKK